MTCRPSTQHELTRTFQSLGGLVLNSDGFRPRGCSLIDCEQATRHTCLSPSSENVKPWMDKQMAAGVTRHQCQVGFFLLVVPVVLFTCIFGYTLLVPCEVNRGQAPRSRRWPQSHMHQLPRVWAIIRITDQSSPQGLKN